jgi:hypothetical protein
VLIVTALGFTVSVPSIFSILLKLAVLSSPAAFLMMKPSFTTFFPDPASVWLPLAVASTVNP